METISLKTKKQVLGMFRQGIRSRKISESLHMDRSVVKEWQYLYDGGDTRWVTDQPISRVCRFPGHQRNLIVKAYLGNALTMADLRRTFLIPKTVLKEWVRHCRRIGPFTDDTRGICKALNLPRFTCYYRRAHPKEDDPVLVSSIRTIQERESFSIGSKRMAKMLVAEGFCDEINHKKAEGIMTRNGLHAKQKVRKHPKDYYRAKRQAAAKLPANILSREFAVDRPQPQTGH